MTTIERLEKWKGGHKARAVTIGIDDSYGATMWQCELWHENGYTVGTEAPWDQSDIDRFYAHIADKQERNAQWIKDQQANGQHAFIAEDWDWLGLDKAINLALDGFELGIWKAK